MEVEKAFTSERASQGFAFRRSRLIATTCYTERKNNYQLCSLSLPFEGVQERERGNVGRIKRYHDGEDLGLLVVLLFYLLEVWEKVSYVR
jgi:hypothetical protein